MIVPRRRPRGPGKKPAQVSVHLRLPAELVEFYSATPNRSAAMRDALTAWAEKRGLDTVKQSD